MTLARRLAKLEASRTPTEVVLSWLSEAHAYATLPEYLASLTGASKEAWPLGRIAAQVETSVRASTKGTPEAVWQAIRGAVGDAWFLFELVLQLNLAARQVRDYEGLRWALLTKWLGLLSTEAELTEQSRVSDPEHAASEAQDWRQTLVTSLTGLYEEAAARSALERRYFEGQAVLFPALAQEWADLVERLEWLAAHADALPELRTDDGPRLSTDELRRRANEGAHGRARELSLIARVEALEMLGEHERVGAIMERQVRTLAEPASPVT